MITARQFQGFSWGILRALLICGWCGPLAAAPYSGGDGTSTTPYALSTAADLVTLVSTPADWGKWFVLTADVDLSSTPVGAPIGNRALPFTGVFDGGGHSLKGLAINDLTATSKPLGLFGVLGAPGVIERLRLTAPSLQSAGPMSAGCLVGEIAQGATVQQCSTEQGSVSTPASDAAGGLVGDSGGTVRECCSTTAVTALGLAGGLSGRSTGLIENCTAAGAVTATKVGTGTAAGGLLGADVGGSIRFCLGNSTSLNGARVGGLVGFASPTSVFANCVCNKVTAKAVENWTADVAGSASCEDPNNLKSQVFFTSLGWDLKTVWFMGSNGVPRLRWMNSNGGPTAVAKGPSVIGPDSATGLAKVVLDGTESVDPDGGTLKYTWKCLTATGQPTNITIDSVASPTVNLPVGTYRIDLIVNNGLVDSAPASITVTVSATAPKDAPTAVAKGPTGVVRPDPATGLAKVTLDGSQSTDPGKKTLKYTWKCLTSTGGLTNITISSVVNPTVNLPPGTYRIELVVSNGTADSTASALTVTVNAAPTATIKGPSGAIKPDPATGLAKITLDGSASRDPEKDALKYTWKCLTPSGGATSVAIDSVATPTVSLQAGTYRIELTVNDGWGDSAPFALSLTVGGTNTPPTAVIKGPPGAVQPDPTTGLAKVALDGSQSTDPDKDPLKYTWRCLTSTGAATGITIEAVAAPTVSLRAGTYRIELTVNDGKADSTPAAITVIVSANTGPTAVAKGPSGIVRPDPATGFAKVALDGSQSSDPDKDPLKYTWKCLTSTGAATNITIESVVNPSVSLRAGAYKIELTVSDGKSSSAPSVVLVTVNAPPVARVSGPQEVSDDGTGKAQVQLDGSQSFDPDAGNGQTLIYSWTCATASPSTASGPTPSMVFPVGTHTVLLVVSDGVESSQATTQVVVISASATTRMKASPSTVGRTTPLTDVKFFLLLPAGKSVSDVDPQAPITLEMNGVRTQLTRDPAYNHKQFTVVAFAPTQRILEMAGPANGPQSARMTVRLKTGETVSGVTNLEIVDGYGAIPAVVLAERALLIVDTQIWR